MIIGDFTMKTRVTLWIAIQVLLIFPILLVGIEMALVLLGLCDPYGDISDDRNPLNPHYLPFIPRMLTHLCNLPYKSIIYIAQPFVPPLGVNDYGLVPVFLYFVVVGICTTCVLLYMLICRNASIKWQIRLRWNVCCLLVSIPFFVLLTIWTADFLCHPTHDAQSFQPHWARRPQGLDPLLGLIDLGGRHCLGTLAALPYSLALGYAVMYVGRWVWRRWGRNGDAVEKKLDEQDL